jgi:hypothetical protein
MSTGTKKRGVLYIIWGEGMEMTPLEHNHKQMDEGEVIGFSRLQ